MFRKITNTFFCFDQPEADSHKISKNADDYLIPTKHEHEHIVPLVFSC